MSATDAASAVIVQTELRTIRALRSQIASAIANAEVHAGSDIDMADELECLRSWLDDGAAPLTDALKGADHMLCAAEDDAYERRVVPHSIAAE